MYQPAFLVAVYVFAAGLTGLAAWQTVRHRHVPGARQFGVGMCGVTAWILLAALSHVPVVRQNGVAISLLWRLEYLPIGVVAVAWLAFGLAYTGRDSVLSRRRVAGLAVVPAVTAVTALAHPMLIRPVAAAAGPLAPVVAPLWLLENLWSTVQWIGTGYIYLLLALGSVFVLEVLVERPVPHVGQALLLLVVVPPWLLNVVHLSGLLAFREFDPTILGLTVSGVAGLFAVGRSRLFDVPLARARIVDEMDSGVLVFGRDGRIYDCNERAVSLLSLPPDIVGTDVRTALDRSQLDIDLAGPTVVDAVEDGLTGTGHSGGERPDGVETVVDGGVASLTEQFDGRTIPVVDGNDPSYVEIRLSTLADATGAQTSRLLLLYDVTERERRERELARSRERYRTLFENNQLIQWEMDLSAAKAYAEELAAKADGDLVDYLDENPEALGRINERMEVLDVNQKTLEFYDVDSKEELVANLDRTITDDSFEGLKHLWQQVVDGETTLRRECEVRTLDGDIRYELLEWNVLEGHEDDFSRVYATSLDITERRNRERELRAQHSARERLQETLAESGDVETVASALCAELTAVDGVMYARADVAVPGGTVETVADAGEPCASASERTDPAAEAVDAGETRVTDAGSEAPADSSARVLAMPVGSADVTRGAVVVHLGTDLLLDEQQVRDLLAETADVLDYAMDAERRRQALASAEKTELTVEVETGSTPLSQAVGAAGVTATLTAAVSRGESTTLCYLTGDGDDLAAVRDAADEIEGIEDVHLVETDPPRLQLVTSGPVPNTVVAEHGGDVVETTVGPTVTTVRARYPRETNHETVLDALTSRFESARVTDYTTAPGTTDSGDPLSGLTRRQREVLAAAVHAGYFESPREQNATEMAEQLGVSRQSFDQVARAAQRNLLESLFDED